MAANILSTENQRGGGGSKLSALTNSLPPRLFFFSYFHSWGKQRRAGCQQTRCQLRPGLPWLSDRWTRAFSSREG